LCCRPPCRDVAQVMNRCSISEGIITLTLVIRSESVRSALSCPPLPGRRSATKCLESARQLQPLLPVPSAHTTRRESSVVHSCSQNTLFRTLRDSWDQQPNSHSHRNTAPCLPTSTRDVQATFPATESSGAGPHSRCLRVCRRGKGRNGQTRGSILGQRTPIHPMQGSGRHPAEFL